MLQQQPCPPGAPAALHHQAGAASLHAAAAAPANRPTSSAASADAAEHELHAGRWQQARGAACEVLAQADAPAAELTRALYVLLQADFQTGRCAASRVG